MQELLSVCPVAVAALLLLARRFCEVLGLPAPAVAEILEATKVSRSAAYSLVDVLAALVPTIARPRGRPPKHTADAPANGEADALKDAAFAFVMQHPGCARAGARQGYSDHYRRFVVEKRAAHAQLDVETFARSVKVPLGTLKDWLRLPVTFVEEEETVVTEATDVQMAQMQTVLTAYKGWSGTFVDFSEHVQRDLRVPFGRALIAHILEAHGARHPQKRGRRSSDELAMRGAFRTFFPGAQWVGDGMQVPVVVDGERFTFNFELNVDAHTGAFVGASVRDEEDSAAVVEALADGVATTGALPTALLIDNKPSNHTPEIDAALGDAIRIRATLERPQNKAHVEGAFGLFSQVLPDLVLDTRRSTHDVARALLVLVVTIWARTTNHRPRAARGGRSRAELYADEPTVEQVDNARRKLREVAERQELARRTIEARRCPKVLALLDEQFLRLALIDPARHIRLAIAGHSQNAIVNGFAIFEAKRRANTLPEGADARYLLGIVKNIDAKTEGEHLAEVMLEMRLNFRDRVLAGLVAAREVICAQPDVTRVCADCVDRALEMDSDLDRTFWLVALVDVLRAQPDAEQRQAHFLTAARRINATFAVPPRDRQDAVRFVADRLVPLK